MTSLRIRSIKVTAYPTNNFVVRLAIEYSSLFHDKKRDTMETVDQYAQDFRSLFNKAYPRIQQGTREAKTFGQTVLVNQFVIKY